MNLLRSRLRRRSLTSSTRHHVLYLIDRLASNGGTEGVLQKICRFLPSDRFRVSVATLLARDDIRENFPCPVAVYPLNRIYGWHAFKCGLELSRFLRSERVDIMHTFFPASDIWGGSVATLSGCPIWVSGRRDMGILRMNKHRLPYLFANHFADQIQAVSEGVREYCIAEERLDPGKVVTVTNGVDLEKIDGAPRYDRSQMYGFASSTPVIVTTANRRIVKGIDVLVRAIPMVRKEFPDAKFLVIGEAPDPTYKRELSDLVSSLGLEQHILFPGARSDVFSLLKIADLFCLPSRSEGLSNALLEAMSCSLPCVATDAGGNSEVVEEGRSGFLVPIEEPHSLADRIITLLRDRELMKSMGLVGRKIVERRFTVQHMVDQLTLLYDRLLEQRGLSSPIIRQRQDPDGKGVVPRLSAE
jgi:L-malate glycosyltransferase